MNWASKNDAGTRGTATHVKRGYSCSHEHVPVAMCIPLLGVYKCVRQVDFIKEWVLLPLWAALGAQIFAVDAKTTNILFVSDISLVCPRTQPGWLGTAALLRITGGSAFTWDKTTLNLNVCFPHADPATLRSSVLNSWSWLPSHHGARYQVLLGPRFR